MTVSSGLLMVTRFTGSSGTRRKPLSRLLVKLGFDSRGPLATVSIEV